MCIDMIIEPRVARISADLTVRRILPYKTKRSVGPLCFLDHMGPHKINLSQKVDVLPHPHIGLSTMTYLFAGQFIHRDSLGNKQIIRPGEVNWMTAGKGIVHSERIPAEGVAENPILHGLQAWLALPKEQEQCEPSFVHYSKNQLPYFEKDGVSFSLAAGTIDQYVSPLKTTSSFLYAKLQFIKDSFFTYETKNQETAFYLVEGSVEIESQIFNSSQLIIFKKHSLIKIRSHGNTLGVFFGGETLVEKPLMDWNFVATRKELIEAAKQKWRLQQFPSIPEEVEFIPLPEKR